MVFGLVETEFVFKTLMRLLLKQYSGLCFSFPNPELSCSLVRKLLLIYMCGRHFVRWVVFSEAEKTIGNNFIIS